MQGRFSSWACFIRFLSSSPSLPQTMNSILLWSAIVIIVPSLSYCLSNGIHIWSAVIMIYDTNKKAPCHL